MFKQKWFFIFLYSLVEFIYLINELKKLHTSLIFNIKVLITINSTHNLYAIFARILDICKQLTSNLTA